MPSASALSCKISSPHEFGMPCHFAISVESLRWRSILSKLAFLHQVSDSLKSLVYRDCRHRLMAILGLPGFFTTLNELRVLPCEYKGQKQLILTGCAFAHADNVCRRATVFHVVV